MARHLGTTTQGTRGNREGSEGTGGTEGTEGTMRDLAVEIARNFSDGSDLIVSHVRVLGTCLPPDMWQVDIGFAHQCSA